MNAADIFFLLGQFPKPRASFDIIMGDRANPNVIDAIVIAKGDRVNPFQYVVPPFSFQHFDVIFRYTG